MRKPRADAKLKSLPEEDQAELWRLLSVPTEGRDKPLTYDELAVEVPLRFGCATSRSALAEWRSWYALRQRMERARRRAAQATLDWARDPGMSAEDLERLGQVVFTAESIEGGDVKAYVQLMRLRNQQRALNIDHRKLELLEKKAAQADEAKEVLGSKLSMEEQNRRLRDILA